MANFIGIENARFEPAIGPSPLRDGQFWKSVTEHATQKLEGELNLPKRIATLALQTKHDLATLQDAERASLAIELGNQLAEKIRKLLPRWHAKYLKNAVEFERRLGIFIVGGHVKQAEDAAEKASLAVLAYLRLMSSTQEMFNELLEQTNTFGDPRWGGKVRHEAGAIAEALRQGNVRERLAHLDAFIDNVLGNDILNSTLGQLDRVLAAAQAAGFNVKKLRERRAKIRGAEEAVALGTAVQRVKARRVATAPRSWELSTRDDTFENKEAFKDVGTFQETGSLSDKTGKPIVFEGMDAKVGLWAAAVASNAGLSDAKKLSFLEGRARAMRVPYRDLGKKPANEVEFRERIAKLVARLSEPGRLQSLAGRRKALGFKDDKGNFYEADMSERERAAFFSGDRRKARRIPWALGAYLNVVNESHEWIKEARKRAMPIESAISGTASRLMNLGEFAGLNEEELLGMRAAVLGFLVNVHAHTFHEIMAAANGFADRKYDYVPGRDAYHRVHPISEQTLQSIAPGGKLPDEHEL